jgi:hypothetical protein
LFLVAAMQAVLVQGQLKLDKLDGEVSARETVRNRLQAQIDQLESPDRLAQQAGAIGMVTPPEVVFLYASPPAASALAASAGSAAAAATPTTLTAPAADEASPAATSATTTSGAPVVDATAHG